jgi:hypothetical protein
MRKRLFVGVLFAVLAGCSHGGSSGVLPGGSNLPVTPQSVSPGTIPAAPMAKTTILPASAMQSPPKSDIAMPPLNWAQVPGTASAVAASPDGSLWVLSDQPSGPDKYIWHYASGAWTNISGLASRLSVAADGSLWALNSGGGIWHYVSGTWTSPGGGATNSVTADSTTGIYVLSNGGSGPDRAIWHYSPGGGWTQLLGSGTVLAANWDTNNFTPGAGVTGPINAGGVYILSSSGSIWYENANQSFSQVPGAASAIAPTTNGGFFVLGYPTASGGNQVYYYDLNTPGFTAQNGAGLLSISANNSNLYLTSSSGSIYSAAVPSFGPVVTGTVTGPSSLPFGTVTLGTPTTIALTVVEKDVNGKTITGTYSNPVSLVNLDQTGATSLNVTTVPSSSTPVTLTYNGSASFTGTRVRAFVDNGATALAAYLVTGPCTLSPGVGRAGYYPCDLQSAYNLASSSASGGSNQTVAIVDAYDDPAAESDLAIYRSAFGLPACTTANGCFKKRAQDGSTNYPVPDAGWAGEISLDVDMVSAICPNCKILLVEAATNSGNNLFAAENEAATLGATEISNSWGLSENAVILGYETNFNHPGIPITASTGDNGYSGGVSYPASSQYVTAVGGTTLMAATGSRGWSETAWGTSGPGSNVGTGSGCSKYIAKPSWQIDGGCTMRMVSDVSAVADPNTAVWTYDTYQSSAWVRVGGTSASSPIIASVYAISGNASSVVAGSYPYAHTSSLYDVTSGTNGACLPDPAYFCTAGTGYDGPTGLGTPNGATGAFIRPLDAGRELPAPLTSLNYHPGPTRRLCPDEFRPGYASCFAIVRTD